MSGVLGVWFFSTLQKITGLESASRNANPENQTAGARPRGMAMINGKIGCELATASVFCMASACDVCGTPNSGKQVFAHYDHTMGIGNNAQSSQQQNTLRSLHDER